MVLCRDGVYGGVSPEEIYGIEGLVKMHWKFWEPQKPKCLVVTKDKNVYEGTYKNSGSNLEITYDIPGNSEHSFFDKEPVFWIKDKPVFCHETGNLFGQGINYADMTSDMANACLKPGIWDSLFKFEQMQQAGGKQKWIKYALIAFIVIIGIWAYSSGTLYKITGMEAFKVNSVNSTRSIQYYPYQVGNMTEPRP